MLKNALNPLAKIGGGYPSTTSHVLLCRDEAYPDSHIADRYPAALKPDHARGGCGCVTCWLGDP